MASRYDKQQDKKVAEVKKDITKVPIQKKPIGKIVIFLMILGMGGIVVVSLIMMIIHLIQTGI
jgi:hypothetical protein